ncbi:MAG TPA: hypothetical protein VEV81_01280, partial [Pyrinomonadaceae bacterium]|nr:hypothetical protein [Pyrinomonadaceae bacterium]
AQSTYQATTGNGAFSSTLSALQTANLVDPVLGTGSKSGYNFTIPEVQAPSTGVLALFAAQADPITKSGASQTGTRVFGITEDGVMRGEVGTAAKTTRATVVAMSALGN